MRGAGKGRSPMMNSSRTTFRDGWERIWGSKAEAEPERLPIPKTVTEFISQFMDSLEESEIVRVRTEYTIDSDSSIFHHTVGRGMRNNFSLWTEESAELKEDLWNNWMTHTQRQKYNKHWTKYGGVLYQGREMHADDASAELMQIIWKHIFEPQV